MAVNEELPQLQDTLPLVWGLLNPGGRLAVIAFHSLEDRLVKQFIKTALESGEARSKPTGDESKRSKSEGNFVDPLKVWKGEIEDAENPRARSAKLRVVEKSSTK